MATIAFADLSRFYEWDSNGIRPRVMPMDGAATKAVAAAPRSNGGLAEVRMHDKLRAIELLAKVVGLMDRPRQ